ncbi:hypothetical protein CPB86DRAFT_362098 [Serendipita vermifera]|nr:hypothetical protein CPB86DRAFT_362098 [Serendipita vermifera]
MLFSGLEMPPHGGTFPAFTDPTTSFPPRPQPNTRPSPAPPPDRDSSPSPRPEPISDTPPRPPDDRAESQDILSEDEDLMNILLKAFPNRPDLQNLANHLLDQEWLQQDLSEPDLDKLDEVSEEALQGVKNPESRFEAFFDPTSSHRCRWYEDGKRCKHTTRRKDRAVGHSRSHFQYKPFQCEGRCGKKGCPEKYTCRPFMKDHINRKKNPRRACSLCNRSLLAQNISRHRKKHHPEASSSPVPAIIENEEQPEVQDSSQDCAGPSTRRLKSKTSEIIAKLLRSLKGFD